MSDADQMTADRYVELVLQHDKSHEATSVRSQKMDMMQIEQHPAWPQLSKLQMPVGVHIPLGRFKVRQLLALQVGQIIETLWSETEDLPLVIAEAQLAWSEFEVAEQRLMVRLTRLA